MKNTVNDKYACKVLYLKNAKLFQSVVLQEILFRVDNCLLQNF